MNEIKIPSVEHIDLIQLLRMLLRKWFIIVGVTVLSFVIGFCHANYFMTPLYRAHSTMLVDLRNSVHDDLSAEQVTIAEKYVSTFAYIMETNIVLDPVIKELGLNESVSSLASKLQISEISDTLLIRVSITHPNPKKALDIIKAIDKTAPEVINQQITSGYIMVVENPTVSTSPVSPNVMRHAVAYGLVGMGLIIVLLMAIFLFNNKIKSVADLQRVVDLPLLGVIPTVQNTDNNGKGA